MLGEKYETISSSDSRAASERELWFLQACERKRKRVEDEENYRREMLEKERRAEREREQHRLAMETRRKALKQRKQQIQEEKRTKNLEFSITNEATRKAFKGAQHPVNDEHRLLVLEGYRVLDTCLQDLNMQRITDMACELLNVPMAFISLVDRYRVWFKSSRGFNNGSQVPRNVALCSFVVLSDKPIVVPDVTQEPTMRSSPLVKEVPYIRFYAGAPFVTTEGFILGGLSLIDTKPRYDFDNFKVQLMTNLAHIVVRELELHRSLSIAKRAEDLQKSIAQFHYEITTKTNLHDSLDTACLTIVENIDVEHAQICEICEVENKWEVRGSFGWDYDIRVSKDLSKRIIGKETVFISDYGHQSLPVPYQDHISCAIAAPIHVDGHLYGHLMVFKEAEYIWSSEEVDYVISFANALERIIEQDYWRNLVTAEKKKCEKLLHYIIPHPIATRLKREERIADKISSATVAFIDICGFTEISSKLCPNDVVQILNMVFSGFDQRADKYGIEKIKTIGDAYMVSGGLLSHEDDHVTTTLDFCLDVLDFVKSVTVLGRTLRVRIGVGTGPVVAGVIGLSKYAYDLWGDAVNVAARMESHGVPDRIQISKDTRKLIPERMYRIEPRGLIEVKGKGPMETFFVSRLIQDHQPQQFRNS